MQASFHVDKLGGTGHFMSLLLLAGNGTFYGDLLIG